MATRVENRTTRPIEAALDDRGLVLAFQAGDRGAYDVIFQRYGPMTERICRRYLINPHDAEEATQETMLRVLRSLPSFNGRYNLRAWVARIATNLCLDKLRQESRKANGEEMNVVFLEHQIDDAAVQADPGEVLERVVKRDEIRAHLEKLPEQHRIALVLRDVEGLGHKEIADVLNTSPAKVKALLHRARKGFRTKWNGGERQLGIMLLPLAWLGGWLRRAQGRVQELATSGANVSPQVSTIAATGGDHMSAALAAVVLAGSLGFAAVSAPPRDAAPEAQAPAEIATAEASTPRLQTGADEQRRTQKRAKGRARGAETAAAAAAVVTEPLQVADQPASIDNSKTPAETRPLPEPEPEATVRPQPAVPEGFTFGFTSDWFASQPCGCTDQPRILAQILREERGEPAEFSSSIEGAVLRDRTGQPGWQIELVQSGDRAQQTVEFTVHTATGAHTYAATGLPVGRERTTWGGWTYRFAGTYESKGDGPEETTPLPVRGTYTSSLTFAVREGRLVEAVFSLADGEYGG